MKMGGAGPTIRAQLGGRMIDLLVDSGMAGCCIKCALLLTGATTRPCKQTWTMASGEVLKVQGQADLALTIGAHVYQHEFNIVEGPFGNNAILGTNLLQQFCRVLNLVRGQLQLQVPGSMEWFTPYPLEDLMEEQLAGKLDKQVQLANIDEKD